MSAIQIIIFSVSVYILALVIGAILALTQKRLDKNIKLITKLPSDNDLSFDDLNIDDLKCVNFDRSYIIN